MVSIRQTEMQKLNQVHLSPLDQFSMMTDQVLDKWKKPKEPYCLYCGVKTFKTKKEYCSEQCKEKDSVWNRQ